MWSGMCLGMLPVLCMGLAVPPFLITAERLNSRLDVATDVRENVASAGDRIVRGRRSVCLGCPEIGAFDTQGNAAVAEAAEQGVGQGTVAEELTLVLRVSPDRDNLFSPKRAHPGGLARNSHSRYHHLWCRDE